MVHQHRNGGEYPYRAELSPSFEEVCWCHSARVRDSARPSIRSMRCVAGAVRGLGTENWSAARAPVRHTRKLRSQPRSSTGTRSRGWLSAGPACRSGCRTSSAQRWTEASIPWPKNTGGLSAPSGPPDGNSRPGSGVVGAGEVRHISFTDESCAPGADGQTFPCTIKELLSL